jgi:hypothetical protein
MEEQTAAVTYRVAPGAKPGEWHQKSLRRVLKKWKAARPNDFEKITESDGFGMVVGFNIYPTGTGQYGYDTGFHFEPDIESHLIDDVVGGDLAETFYSEWVEALQEVIREEQEATMFSSKEFATFFAHRHPTRGEKQNADALDITVGTYRGKVGRVKSKLEEARKTLGLEEICPESDDADDWKRDTHQAPLSVLHRVDEDRLPVTAVSHIDVDGVSLDDFPVDELIRG